MGVADELVFGPCPDVDQIGVGDRIEHIISFNAQYNFGLLGKGISPKSQQEHGKTAKG